MFPLGAPYLFSTVLCIFLAGCVRVPELGDAPTLRVSLKNYNKDRKASAHLSQSWWNYYQDAQLNQLMEEGLTQAPSLTIAQARLLKAEALAEQMGAIRLPEVNLDATFQKHRQSYNNGVPAAFVPKGFQSYAQGIVNVRYELDFWSKNKASVEAIMAQAHAARLETAQAKILLSTSIAAAYAQLAELYAQLDAANESFRVRTQTSTLFKQRFDTGLENEGSLDQAYSSKASAAAEVAALHEAIALAKNGLLTLVGRPPSEGALLERPSVIPLHLTGFPEEQIPLDLIARRPDLQALKFKLEAAAKRIDVARAGFYPNIDVTAYLGQQSLGWGNIFKRTSLTGEAGPALHLPLFDGGRLKGQYKGARADYDESLAQYESAIFHALQEVSDALTSKKALALRTEKTQEALSAAQKAYGTTQNRYAGGLATYLEVLRAEDLLIATRKSMAHMNTRAFILDIALIKALGGALHGLPLPQKEEVL